MTEHVSSGGAGSPSSPTVRSDPAGRAVATRRRRRRVRWFPLAAGLILLVPILWMAATAFGAVWHGHPALPITLGVVTVAGLGLVLLAFRPRRIRPSRHPHLRLAASIVGLVLAAVLAGTLVWLTPFPATPEALTAMSGSSQVQVIDRATTIELRPSGPTAAVGLVFSPGARVDARAYVDVLLPQAEAGYLVVILKVPFGLGIADVGQSAGPIAEHPEIGRWVVGGHSLGGTSASMFAARRPAGVVGLLFYASYPNDDLSDRTDLTVASVSGSNDGLATPAKIDAHRSSLPPGATYTVVQGAVHADFGDYGAQPGDGVASIDHADAQAQIAAATTDLLRAVAAR